MNGTAQPRYTLYEYNSLHWAIDCEDCNYKIANLTPNFSGGEIVDRINRHKELWHKKADQG